MKDPPAEGERDVVKIGDVCACGADADERPAITGAGQVGLVFGLAKDETKVDGLRLVDARHARGERQRGLKRCYSCRDSA